MPKRVLVVDDHVLARELIRDAFCDAGFEVHTAGNGAECLLAVASWQPDLIVMDVAMPVLDGLDTLYLLRQNPATVNTPVIILSGRDHYEEVRAGWRAGADMYLTKPIRLGAVLAAARSLLNLAPHHATGCEDVVHKDEPLAAPAGAELAWTSPGAAAPGAREVEREVG